MATIPRQALSAWGNAFIITVSDTQSDRPVERLELQAFLILGRNISSKKTGVEYAADTDAELFIAYGPLESCSFDY